MQKIMNPFKHLACSLLAALAVWAVQAAEPKWHTDLAKAKEKARAANKHILINFTGSDWCGFCIKLQKEVFSKPEFAEYAQKHLVLVEIDFPRNKEQPETLKTANRKLQKEYKVSGFPTLLLLDSQGKKVGQMVGYGGGGLDSVLSKLGLKTS